MTLFTLIHQDKAPRECDNHKAARDIYVQFLGVNVSGVGAVTCARHSCFMPRGMVDFFRGERFTYIDYAFTLFVRYVHKDGPLDIGVTYDIWCHWHVKFNERAKEYPSEIELLSDLNLIGGIPKFHLVGHQQSCHNCFSLNYMQSVGRIEGEGCERAWAYLNETAGSTSEMSPGFRRDSINYLLFDWHFSKMIGMRE
ncbi:hypothetical protein BDV93DRAFT_450059 [Ceratobasidium sp. AG-I]|nr:hypothetical protein BDV93DRAFT_450059 [Ceratobasidium sp. AG-I]